MKSSLINALAAIGSVHKAGFGIITPESPGMRDDSHRKACVFGKTARPSSC